MAALSILPLKARLDEVEFHAKTAPQNTARDWTP
jgi:hypothetical protein